MVCNPSSEPKTIQLRARLESLGVLLQSHRRFWIERPFVRTTLSWERDCSGLAQWLRTRSLEDVTRYEGSAEALASDAPDPLPQLIAAGDRLTKIAGSSWVPSSNTMRFPTRSDTARDRGVSRRKHVQIERLAAIVKSLPPSSHWVDWCAGKGHLGRRIATWLGRSVVFIERDVGLCQAGQELDAAWGTRGTWIPSDVHDRACHEWLEGAGVIALHACGDLHRRLIEVAIERGSAAVVLAPCCYHRGCTSSGMGTADAWSAPPPPITYLPRSIAGTTCDPEIDEHALRLATSGQVVASPAKAARRERAELYRVVLSEAVARATGRDFTPVPLPSLPHAWFAGSPEAFVERAARRFRLPARPGDVPELMEPATERLRITRALGLVRSVFRRPIEAWLVADLAMRLAERGYEAEVVEWCGTDVTPRNLAILAYSGAHHGAQVGKD